MGCMTNPTTSPAPAAKCTLHPLTLEAVRASTPDTYCPARVRFIRRPGATCRANGAPCADVLYPAWRQEVSNEAFDRAQGLALRLTDMDRADGRPGTPGAGYSARNIARAEAAVRGAQR